MTSELDPKLLTKYNLITLSTMFNTKPEHGDVYINCNKFIKLLNNYYIHSTSPMSVLEFPRSYFPFTINESESPILFANSFLFNPDEKIINPDCIRTTNLKITCLIISLLHVHLKKKPDQLLKLLNNSKNDIKHFTGLLYFSYWTLDISILENKMYPAVSYSDLEDCTKYILSVFKEYDTFRQLLAEYQSTFGVQYDFFR